MKVVQINVHCGSGSTGRLCAAISLALTEQGTENYVFYSSGNSQSPFSYRYLSRRIEKFHALRSKILGNYGFNTYAGTKKLIAQLQKIRPDIVHLHNLHGHNCHLGLLFSYLKKENIRVFWTFHDCWAMTAYCPHYDMNGCEKWKHECQHCPHYRKYSWFLDRSRLIYRRKKELFTAVNLSIIAPSHWMERQVKQSFLRECPVQRIYNGIDLTKFVPREGKFRDKYHCYEKYIVLGVAYKWNDQKGLSAFLELSESLGEEYRIVLVGSDANVDKILPKRILSIHRTQSIEELAEIYSAADVFVNPTMQEVFGLTNIEALACGTPVITYNTGGSPECIDETCGIAVMKNDVLGLEREIVRICTQRPYSEENCIKRAASFSVEKMYREYMDLYL